MSGEGEKILESFRAGDSRALSRLMSMAENGDERVMPLLAAIFPQAGRARVLGVTGVPGAGKSTLINLFVKSLRAMKRKVAVVAVDPVSPFSGGAILGDRIRLLDHFNDPMVFIRSLSTRGKLGGLSTATRQLVHLADAFGFDDIIVETVGVGQSEVDVRRIADLTAILLVPEWGDSVQMIKAGLLEIGDAFVVNKADREGADRLVTELVNMLQLAGKTGIPVLTSSGLDPDSVRKVFEVLDRLFTESKAVIAKRRAGRSREAVSELLENGIAREAKRWVAENVTDAVNPYQFMAEFRKKHPEGTLFGK